MSQIALSEMFWKPVSLADGEQASWAINDAKIRVQKVGDEWQLAHKLLSPQAGSAAEDGWPEPSRYIANSASQKLVFTPLPPDRPAVVNPEASIKILPGSEGTFFINIPVWLELAVFAPERVKLAEFPGSSLPTTWFGGPTEGVLSYALATRAGRNLVAPRKPSDITIAVPLRIKNLSRETVELKDLCLHCEHLSVFQGKSRLWSNEVLIEFLPDLQSSKITYLERPPNFEPLSQNVAPPRLRARQDILSRSYSFLKNFAS